MSTEDLDAAAPSDGRQVLLRALDSISATEQETGNEAKHVIVCWAVPGDDTTVRGWDSTDDPTFIQTGLLREVANAIESTTFVEEDDD